MMNTSTTTKFTPSTTTTAIKYGEELTTSSTINNKPYEFHSNFSRNNDSVFVSLRSNVTDASVSINNTFISNKYHNYPCEIIFNEHTSNTNQLMINTKILINFDGIFTRDLANQFTDRLYDIVDLLSTVRSMKNQNNTVETV